jgi:hypothetical protein
MPGQNDFVSHQSLDILVRFRSKLPGPTLNLMKLQGTFDALPQVMVAHGHEFAKPFPLPTVRAPFIHAVLQAPADIATFGDERYPRGTIECFKPSYDG